MSSFLRALLFSIRSVSLCPCADLAQTRRMILAEREAGENVVHSVVRLLMFSSF
jgi:hypothetical protein